MSTEPAQQYQQFSPYQPPPQASPPPPEPELKKSPFRNILQILVVIIFIVLAFLAYKNNLFAKINFSFLKNVPYINKFVKYEVFESPRPAISPSPMTILEPTATPSASMQPKTEWKTFNFSSLFSFNYPDGWHVAQLWGDSTSGINIVMDPNPISTAPRDGPLATVVINIKNGLQNPDAVFVEQMQKFKDSVSNLQEETTLNNMGTIYHLTGNLISEIAPNQYQEKYFLHYIKKPNDTANQQIIEATIYNQEYTQLLNEIILSLEESKLPTASPLNS